MESGARPTPRSATTATRSPRFTGSPRAKGSSRRSKRRTRSRSRTRLAADRGGDGLIARQSLGPWRQGPRYVAGWNAMVTRSSALADAFAAARAARRVALIAYVVAGDPDARTTEHVVDALSEAGVDLIELGIPYGDPLADGPTIAAAAQRALQAGTTVEGAFQLAARVRQRGSAPTLFFTYANPVDRLGTERFAEATAAAGAAGAIVPDIPFEESAALRAALESRGLVLPLWLRRRRRRRAPAQSCAASSRVRVRRFAPWRDRRRPASRPFCDGAASRRVASLHEIADRGRVRYRDLRGRSRRRDDGRRGDRRQRADRRVRRRTGRGGCSACRRVRSRPGQLNQGRRRPARKAPQVITALIFALFSADQATPAPVAPPFAHGAPITINTCVPVVDKSGPSVAGVSLTSTSSGIRIQFTNESSKPADLINFAVDSNGEQFVIRDVRNVFARHRDRPQVSQRRRSSVRLAGVHRTERHLQRGIDPLRRRNHVAARQPEPVAGTAPPRAARLTANPARVLMDRSADSELFLVSSSERISAFRETDDCANVAAIFVAVTGIDGDLLGAAGRRRVVHGANHRRGRQRPVRAGHRPPVMQSR